MGLRLYYGQTCRRVHAAQHPTQQQRIGARQTLRSDIRLDSLPDIKTDVCVNPPHLFSFLSMHELRTEGKFSETRLKKTHVEFLAVRAQRAIRGKTTFSLLAPPNAVFKSP